jgi:hypothetical protein
MLTNLQGEKYYYIRIIMMLPMLTLIKLKKLLILISALVGSEVIRESWMLTTPLSLGTVVSKANATVSNAHIQDPFNKQQYN